MGGTLLVAATVPWMYDEGLAPVPAGQSGAGREAMDCRQLAGALGLELVPAKVEGVRRNSA